MSSLFSAPKAPKADLKLYVVLSGPGPMCVLEALLGLAMAVHRDDKAMIPLLPFDSPDGLDGGACMQSKSVYTIGGVGPTGRT